MPAQNASHNQKGNFAPYLIMLSKQMSVGATDDAFGIMLCWCWYH